MDKLLKEAIADAKTVRETALANAKLALEEAFAPKLQSMLAAKLNEEEDEMEDETEEEMDETANMFEKEDESAEEAPAEDEEVEETLDLDAIIAELENEAKGEDEEEMEEPKTEAAEDDEEVDLDELLAALQEADDEEEKEDMDEAKDDEEEKEKVEEIRELRSELNDYRQAVVFLKDKINEINLLNAKLLYTNKLFKNHSLTESQKVKILESLDRTKTVREVKLVYSTLAESLNEIKSSKKKITESLGFASRKTGGTTKTILEEGNTLASRLQTLANINVNKKK